MNWRNSFGHVDKHRIAVYAVMAAFFIGLGLHIVGGVNQRPDDKPERSIKASHSSPSGRQWFLLVDVYQQLFISLIEWSELEIASVESPELRKTVLKFNGKVYGVRWLDDERATIILDNSAVISYRIRSVDGVAFNIEFQPNDPARRREELVRRNTPKAQWEFYNLEPD